jgi:hypothetical protein
VHQALYLISVSLSSGLEPGIHHAVDHHEGLGIIWSVYKKYRRKPCRIVPFEWACVCTEAFL